MYDLPVSNNGARIRLLLYKAGLEGAVSIESPQALGGLRSGEYRALHPQGKMPLLVAEGGSLAVPESEVIVMYLLDRFAAETAAFVPATLEERTRCNLLTRLHDVYLTGASPTQLTTLGAMYKAMPADERAEKLASLDAQLDDLERLAREGGAWLATQDAPSTCDFAIFPSMIFVKFMAPIFGWSDPFDAARRPKLAAWWAACLRDADFKRVFDEVDGALQGWKAGGRWDKIGASEQVAASPERYKH